MYLFARNSGLDLTTYKEPSLEDRSGPPLSQGFLLTLISMVIGGRCSQPTLDRLAAIDPNAWYHGQLVESVLDEAARHDADAPLQLGRAVYFMLPSQVRALDTPERFFAGLPALWVQVTRGDSGWFRCSHYTPGSARVELAQPYNCEFEEGAVLGFLDGIGCEQLVSKHVSCLRKGAPFCTLEVTWNAAAKHP